MGNYIHKVFQVPAASTSWADPPLHSRPVEGEHSRGPREVRRRCGMWLESHEWKEREMDQESCLGIKDHTKSLDSPCRSASLAALEKHISFSSPAASWKIKKLCSLLLRLYGNPWARIFTQYKKGGKKPKQVVNFSSPSRGEVFSW